MSLQTLLDYRLWRYAMVGVANTSIGLAVIFGCKALLNLGDVTANFIGYATALLFGFLLNKRWTFEHKGDAAGALGRYLLVRVIAYASNLGATLFAIEVMQMGSYEAQALGVIPHAVAGYLGSRLFAFATPRQLMGACPRARGKEVLNFSEAGDRRGAHGELLGAGGRCRPLRDHRLPGQPAVRIRRSRRPAPLT